VKSARRENIALSGLLALLLLAGAVDWQVRPPVRHEVRTDGSRAGLPVEAPPTTQPELSPTAAVQIFDAGAVMPVTRSQPPVPPIPAKEILAKAEQKQPVVEPVPATPVPRPQREPERRSEAKPTPPREQPATPSQTQQSPTPPPQPTPVQSPPTRTAPTSATSSPAAPASPPAGGLKPGQYPPLVVEFDTIGLDRYAQITEQAGGAFFAYVSGEGLGPRVSLSGREPPANSTGAELVTERPYLVSDPAVGERLSHLSLNEKVSRSSVVMLWPRWLDARAWDAVEAALREEKIVGDQVIQVDARLVEVGGRPVLRIEGFSMQPDGQTRRLVRPRTVRITS
jgi:outer membrane biosynthesis protein TonB